MEYRVESDSMGEVKVPSGKFYGAQTQRSFENFKIGGETFPSEFIRAMAIVKKAAAITNSRLGILEPKKADAIMVAAQEVVDGRWQADPVNKRRVGNGLGDVNSVVEVMSHV